MTNVVDYYEAGLVICVRDSQGRERQYVPLATYERVVSVLQGKCSCYEAGRDYGCPHHGQTAGKA